MTLKLTPKTDFLGTGTILYVCEIVFCHNLSCMLLTIYAILSLKAITLAPGWICLLLIVTLLRLSNIAFVKANRVDPDDVPYSVDYHLGVLIC